MRSFFALVVVSCFVLSFSTEAVRASHSLGRRKRHPANQVSERADRGLEKRSGDARFTWYDAGLGACGKVNSASDFIVALNAPEFGGGSHCFDEITITVNGKSTQAQIVDECMGCPPNALDFSKGLFEFFASTDVGELTGSWQYGSGNPQPTTSTSTWKPPPSTSHSSSPKPSPTTTSTSWTPTTTSSSTSSSSSSSTSSSSSSASSSSPSSSSVSSVTSSSATSPTGTAIPTGVLAQIYLALGNIGAEIVLGADVGLMVNT